MGKLDAYNWVGGDLWTRIALSQGKIEGAKSLAVEGYVEGLAKDIPTVIWPLGPSVPDYQFVDTPTITKISSSNAGDTQQTLIIGLDAEGYEVQQVVVLNGQNKVTLPVPLRAVNGGLNISSVNYLGNIYVYVDTAIVDGVPADLTKVKGYIKASDNAMQIAFATTPVNTTTSVFNVFTSLLGTNISATAKVQTYAASANTNVFRLIDQSSLTSTGSSRQITPIQFPITYPGLTKIKNIITANVVGAGASSGVEFVILNDTF